LLEVSCKLLLLEVSCKLLLLEVSCKLLLLEVSCKLLFPSNCQFENIFSPYFCHEISNTEFSLGELPTIQLKLHILIPMTMDITSFWDMKPIQSNTELVNLFEGMYPKYVHISKKFFCVPMVILKSKMKYAAFHNYYQLLQYYYQLI
jgi:hypothetical protein